MTVDLKTARTIAELAKLELASGTPGAEDPGVLERLTEEFSKIVGYMDILSEVDTDGVLPLYSPMLSPEPPREDAPLDEAARQAKAEAILDHSPRTSGRFFVVPRVV
jgi:aspartyl-tRNA(Asn)/glutamyl-tRNA(Gln) amidotransferase subunit C